MENIAPIERDSSGRRAPMGPDYEGFTERVLRDYSDMENPRLRFIVTKLIEHLHAYLVETRITDREYEFAWDFMKRMADITSPERNEFILFADVVGVSQLIETLNHESPDQPVGFALLGPFYRANAPFREKGSSIASDDTLGKRVRISGRVLDYENNAPIAGAVLDIWQAATNGFYENQDESQPDYSIDLASGRKEYPFGEDATGYIHYGDTGIMAVQISRKSRKEAGDVSDLKHDYLAYFGRYEVDAARQVVRHFVEGQLFPGEHPGVLERKYRFDGDTLSLKPLDGTNREIVWRRVREQAAAKAA